MKKKSILIDLKPHKDLCELADSHNRSIKTFVEDMIYFFKKTGQDPKLEIKESASAQLKILDKRLVSFLKVQERDILKPLQIEVSKTREIVEEKLNANANFSTPLSSDTTEQMIAIEKRIVHLQEGIQTLADFLDDRNKSGLQGRIKNIFQ